METVLKQGVGMCEHGSKKQGVNKVSGSVSHHVIAEAEQSHNTVHYPCIGRKFNP